jgi:hypothetical protein
LSFSNSMSIIAIWTINPAVTYILNTLSKVCTKRLAVLNGKCSIVTKLKPREEDSRTLLLPLMVHTYAVSQNPKGSAHFRLKRVPVSSKSFPP